MALTAEQWFPSVIWSGMMDGADNAALETYAQDKKQIDEGVQVSNYVGWQSGPIRQGDNEEFDKLVGAITEQVNACAVQADIPELQIQNIWMNARVKAVNFYLNLNYIDLGFRYEIKGIGLHYFLYKELQ